MMSLYNLWRFRIGFALVVVGYGVAMGVYGLTHQWDRDAALLIPLACWLGAALLFPWTRAQRPPRPEA